MYENKNKIKKLVHKFRTVGFNIRNNEKYIIHVNK